MFQSVLHFFKLCVCVRARKKGSWAGRCVAGRGRFQTVSNNGFRFCGAILHNCSVRHGNSLHERFSERATWPRLPSPAAGQTTCPYLRHQPLPSASGPRAVASARNFRMTTPVADGC
uniref:(northern house mosquito) hypothetical protein n=1 Tax=Culex pipiens TaxID=7175 RepID=A0A8D8HFL8_CULPI